MAISERDHDIAKRLRAIRTASGLSRERLADLAGVSAETIRMVERTKRRLTIETARKISGPLRVTDLGELFGPEVRMELDTNPSHPGVPAVRAALTSYRVRVTGDAQSPAYLDQAVDAAWTTWHTSRTQRTEAGLILPGLLTETQRATRLLEGADRRRALAAHAEALHLGQAYLAWHGDKELMWLTVDRAMAASLDADDPLSIARSCWYAAHLHRAAGNQDQALQLLQDARELADPMIAEGGYAWAEMAADIELCDGLTRARRGDQGAWARLERAKAIVHRALPEDFVGIRTRVSRALIDVYAVMYSVDLGDGDEARRLAHALDPATIPSTERRGRHFVELARAADLEGSPEAALMLMRRAWETSPETVQFSPPGRELVRELARDAPAAVRAEAQELAVAVGVLID